MYGAIWIYTSIKVMNLAVSMVEAEQTLICNFAAKLSVQIDESAARAEVHDICFATVVDNFILFS